MKLSRKINRKTVFAIVIGIMMVTWAIGLALSFNIKSTDTGMQIKDVYDRPLTVQEKIGILRAGRVLIEYIHNGTQENVDRSAEYQNFAARLQGFVVLETFEVSQANQTVDQMISPNGDIVPLYNVTAGQMMDVFCDNSAVQPRDCLLRSI